MKKSVWASFRLLAILANSIAFPAPRAVRVVGQDARLLVVDDVVVLVLGLPAGGEIVLLQLADLAELFEDGVVEPEAVVLHREVADGVKVHRPVGGGGAEPGVEDERVLAPQRRYSLSLP